MLMEARLLWTLPATKRGRVHVKPSLAARSAACWSNRRDTKYNGRLSTSQLQLGENNGEAVTMVRCERKDKSHQVDRKSRGHLRRRRDELCVCERTMPQKIECLSRECSSNVRESLGRRKTHITQLKIKYVAFAVSLSPSSSLDAFAVVNTIENHRYCRRCRLTLPSTAFYRKKRVWRRCNQCSRKHVIIARRHRDREMTQTLHRLLTDDYDRATEHVIIANAIALSRHLKRSLQDAPNLAKHKSTH